MGGPVWGNLLVLSSERTILIIIVTYCVLTHIPSTFQGSSHFITE